MGDRLAKTPATTSVSFDLSCDLKTVRQFTQDGPGIPEPVIQAQEEGNLLLFCGAGVSMPAGLPSFPSLVEAVYDQTGAAWKEEEREEFCDENYDRTLGLLERPKRLGRDIVRRAVYEELRPGDDPNLRTHEALLDLARTRDGELRIVTTNFDRLFERADGSISFSAAPRLPTPKPHKWSGLVYLHGRLGDNPDENEDLVLTAGDFGVAYLTERWASRFVTELFRHFTVVFVGYRVGDPVLRYMVDAFAAEQQKRGDETYSAYAFAAYDEGEKERVRREWEAKRIKPILYNKEGEHRRLHDTLRRWAEIWSGGLTSKKNLVTTNGEKPPELLSKEKVDLVTWALSDPSGAPARAFREMGADAPIGWLEILWEEGLLGDPDNRATSPPIVARHSLRNTEGQLPQPRKELIRWLLDHLDSRTLVEWVINKGGHLHPQVQAQVNLKLEREESVIPEAYEKVWRLLTARDELLCETVQEFSLFNRIKEETWDSSLRDDFLSMLGPCLNLSPARVPAKFGHFQPGGTEEDTENGPGDDPSETTISDLIHVDCEVQAGQHAQHLVDSVRNRDDWDSVLEDIWLDLTKLLRRAVDLQARAGAANEYSDPSYVEHPSIRPSEQNNFFSGWTHLIDLCREAIDKLGPHPPLQMLLWEWRDRLVFRRLLLHYFTQYGKPEVDKLLPEFEKNPSLWVWCNPLRAELYLALPQVWDECDWEGKQALTDLLVQGPPRDMYIEGLEPEEWEYRKANAIWNRLIRLQSLADDELTDSARATLEEIKISYPDWEFEGTEKERLPHWSETRWGHRTDFTTKELLNLPNEELARVLIEHDENRKGLIDAWQDVVIQVPERSLDVLRLIDETPDVPHDIWGSALRGMSETDFEIETHSQFLGLVNQRPDADLEAVINPATRFAEYIAPGVKSSDREMYFSYWDRLLPLAIDEDTMENEDCVMVAINHPLGKLAGGLMKRLRVDVSEGSTGLGASIQERIEQLLGLSGSAERVVTAIICSRLSLLFSVAPEWTEEHVIPKLRWEDTEIAVCAWQGYLWGASVDPSLWPRIKPHYLDTLDHLDQLSDQNTRNLAQLLAIVGIEFPEGLGTEEMSESLRALGPTGRVAVARWVDSRLDGAGDRAPTLWRQEVGPWIREVWPPEREHRSSEESIGLSRAAIKAGEAFPDAVEDIGSYLVPVDRVGLIIHPLLEEGFPEQYPESSLLLLSEIIGDNTVGYSKIGECLNRIREGKAEIDDEPEYERLRRMAMERGWF